MTVVMFREDFRTEARVYPPAASRHYPVGAAANETGDGFDNALQTFASECEASAMLVICHGDTPAVKAVNAGADGSHLRHEFHRQAQDAIHRSRTIGSGDPLVLTAGRFLTAVMQANGETVSCTLMVAPAEDCVRRAAARLQQCLPFLRTILLQWRTNERLSVLMGAFASAIEHNDIATALLGSGGEIRHANSAAQRLMEQGDGIRRRDTRLECATMGDTLRLLAALGHVGAAGGEERGTSPVLMLRRKRRRPLLITLVAAGEGGAATGGEIAAVAYIIDPEQNLTEIVEPACRLYGLSPSETRLACALADGASLKDAARAQSVQEQTARSYLKQIFAKTETKRQGELVQLMLKSAVRVVSSCRKRAFL